MSSRRVHGSGKVVMIKGAAGIELETGVVWYPDQDLEEYEGEVVKVTIERLGPESGRHRIGFVAPAQPERKRRRRK